MKKIIYSALALAMCAVGANADELKMDARSSQIAFGYQQMVKYPGQLIALPLDAPFEADGLVRSTPIVGCIITLADGASAADVEKYGLTVTADLDDVVVAEGPVDAIIELAKSDVVTLVDFARKLDTMTDKSREVTGQATVHAGTGLPQKYDGTGVLCGIYDSGIDPNHVNFYDMAFKGTRVKAIWKATGSGGTGVSYTDPTKIAGFTTDNANGTHGTHTLGCMTGGYNQSGSGTGTTKPKGWFLKLNSTATGATSSATQKNPYYGMAPGADIFVGCGELYDANILKAVSDICNYSEANNIPAVVNLSIGHTRGSHDGTDATSRKLAELGKRAIIFIASGNEGDSNLSIVKTLSNTDKEVKTILLCDRNFTASVDIYSNSDKQFTVKPIIFDKSTNKILYSTSFSGVGTYVLAAKNMTNTGYAHAAEFDDAFTNSSSISVTGSDNASTSKRYNVSINVNCNFNTTTNKNRNKVIGFIVEGQPGQRIDMVKSSGNYTVDFSSNGQTGWSDGTPDLSISGMACGENVIVVGAYTPRNKWPVKVNYNGSYTQTVYTYTNLNGLDENEAAGFSSYGVLADGRTLPDICAPGVAIISSYSSYYTNNNAEYDGISACYTWNGRNYAFSAEQGTSMATPITAGIVATWLQAKPDLKVDEVRDILKSTATRDEFVTNGKYDAVKWGAGKVNAYEGLKKVLNLDAVNDITVDEKDIFVADKGGNQFELFVAGAKQVDGVVYNMSGVAVGRVSESGDTAVFDGSQLAKGIYIVNVNGLQSSRIVVK